MHPRKISRYGWKPDIPDQRDQMFVGDVLPVQVIPDSIDLRPMMPPVYDQGQLGSCTANGIAAAFEYLLHKENLPDFMPSRLFIYYNERAIEGTVNSDSGAMIRDGIKTVNQIGVCKETTWPYNITQFTVKPSPTAYAEALQNKALSYKKIVNTRESLMRLSLANGIPIIIGFTVYESFESQAVAQTGDVPLPQPNETILGGHCVLVVGYDVSGKNGAPHPDMFLCRNSWGTGWGLQGYFWMPAAYLTNPNLAADFWALQIVN